MTKYQFSNPNFRRLGYLIWGVLLVFSVIFFRERVLFLDAGFQVFKMINEGIPQIYHYRFSTLFIQILPFSAFLLGFSLKTIMILYSASYILFFGIIYHLIIRHLSNDYLGWALIFLFTLITLDSFYFIQSEYYLAQALLLLTFGIILRFPDLKKRWIFPVFVPLLLTVVFSHKLTLIPFTFLWIFFWLNNSELRHKRYYLLFGLFIAFFLFKSQFYTNWYEASKGAVFSDNLDRFFPNYFDIPANGVFLERVLKHYYWFPILLILVSFIYIIKAQNSKRSQSYFSLILIWAFCIGQILIYAIADPDSPYRFYAELNYLPLIIFTAVPFFFETKAFCHSERNEESDNSLTVRFFAALRMTKKKGIQFGLGVVFILMISRLGIIASNHQTFENRIVWMQSQLKHTEKLATNRFLIHQKDIPQDLIIQDWGIPYNTLLLTSLESPDSAKTIFIHEDFDNYKRKDLLEKDDYFLTRFHNQAIRTDSMNLDYFRLGKGNYKYIKH